MMASSPPMTAAAKVIEVITCDDETLDGVARSSLKTDGRHGLLPV
jgi:hypothetical protein